MIYAKAAAYLVGWVALVVVLIRVIVGPLWGSATVSWPRNRARGSTAADCPFGSCSAARLDGPDFGRGASVRSPRGRALAG